jgi:Zn-dependent peptidase ImmA (M78 family)
MACLIDSQQQIDMETRANAFAIKLLLTADVDRKKEKLLTPVVFREVMEVWGIHFAALRLFVKNLLMHSDEKMAKVVPSVETNAPLHIRDAEELEAERSPLAVVPLPRRGELVRLVLQEFSEGRLSTGRARELLRVDATVELGELARISLT